MFDDLNVGSLAAPSTVACGSVDCLCLSAVVPCIDVLHCSIQPQSVKQQCLVWQQSSLTPPLPALCLLVGAAAPAAAKEPRTSEHRVIIGSALPGDNDAAGRVDVLTAQRVLAAACAQPSSSSQRTGDLMLRPALVFHPADQRWERCSKDWGYFRTVLAVDAKRRDHRLVQRMSLAGESLSPACKLAMVARTMARRPTSAIPMARSVVGEPATKAGFAIAERPGRLPARQQGHRGCRKRAGRKQQGGAGIQGPGGKRKLSPGSGADGAPLAKRQREEVSAGADVRPGGAVGRTGPPQRPPTAASGAKLTKQKQRDVRNEELRDVGKRRKRGLHASVQPVHGAGDDVPLDDEQPNGLRVAPMFATHLKAHQKAGLGFLWRNIVDGSNLQAQAVAGQPSSATLYSASDEACGAILAHSMGLGKSLTSIAFIHTFCRLFTGRVLVVVPTNVLNNWFQEFTMWLPGQTDNDGKSITATLDQAAGKKLKVFKSESAVQLSSHVKLWASAESAVLLMTPGCFMNVVLTSRGKAKPGTKGHPLKKGRAGPIDAQAEHPAAAAEPAAARAGAPAPPAATAATAAPAASARAPVGMPSEAAARTGAAGTSGGGAAAAACAAHREPGAAADGVLPGVQPPERTPDQQATAQVAPGLKGDGHQVRDALLSQCAIIIVDEAHEMRNKGGRLCKAMQKVQTLRRAALTGFPLQNNLNEYYSMLEWVRQGFISAAEFQADFVLPIKAGQASGASQDDRRGAREQLSLLNEFTESFIHRVGPELLQATLPRKTESVVLLKVADMQLNIYQELLKGLKRCTIIEDFHLLSRLLNNPHKFEELLKAEPERLCELMEGQAQEVREQARSEDEAEVEPGTATPAPPTPSGAQQGGAAAHGAAANARKAHMVNVFQELGALVEARRAELRATCGSSNSAGAVDVWGPSPKLEFIKSILRYCLDHGEKLVIFAQALPTLDSVEARVLQPLGLKSSESYYRIDGNVPPKKRADFIKNFNDPTKDVRVMLLGTKSGSLGINLTSAQRLVLLDVPWNPVFNAQAIARVFRIGQVKPTFVYRLVYAGTVEERVYRLSIDKEKLFNSVVDKKATRTVDNADASYYDYHPPVKQTRQLLEVCLSGRSPGHAHEDAALQLVARDDALLDMVADCYSHDSRLAEDPVGNLSKLELRTVAAKYMERCPQELEGHNTRHKQLWRQLQRLLDKDDEMVVESRSAAKAVAASSPEGASPAVPLACPGVPDAPLAAAALHQGQVAPAAQPSATHTHVPPNRTLEQVVQAALRDAAAPLPSDATARQAGALPISSRNPSAVATSKQARASSASHTAQPAAAASVAVPAVTAPRDAQPRSGVAPPACRTPALPAAPFPQPRGLPHVGAGPAAEPHADVCRHSAAPAAAAPPAHGDPPAPPSRTAAPASTPPPVGAASPPGAPPASQRAQAPHVAAPRPSATRRITPVAVTPSRHTQSAPGVVVPTQAHISSAVAAMDRPGATCAARPAPAAAGARPPGAVAQSPASARVPPPAAAAAATTSAAAAADRSPCAPAAVTPLSSAAAGRAPGVLSASPSSRGAPGTATPRPRKVHSTKGNGLPHADPAVPALQHVVVPPPAAPPARRFGQPPETAAVPAGPDSAAAATPLLVNATAAAPGGTAPAPPGGTRPGGALPNGSPAPLTSTAPLASTAAPPPAQGGLPTGTAPRPTSGHPQEPVTGIATTVTVADASKGSADRAAVAAMAAVNPSMENTGDGVPAAAAAHAASAAAPVGAQPLSMPSGRSGPSSQGKGSAALPKLGAPLARHHLAKRCSTAVPPMDEDWMRPGRDAAAAQVAGPTSAPPAATAIPGVVTSTLAPAQHAAEPPATHHTDFSFVTHAPPAALPAIVPAASLGPLPAIKLSPGGPAAPAGPIGALSGAPAAPQGPPQPRLGARLGLRSGGQHEEQRTADFTVPAPPHQSSAAGEPSGKQAPTSVAPELPVVTSAVPDATPAATCAGAAVQHLDGVMSNNVVDLTLDDE